MAREDKAVEREKECGGDEKGVVDGVLDDEFS